MSDGEIYLWVLCGVFFAALFVLAVIKHKEEKK